MFPSFTLSYKTPIYLSSNITVTILLDEPTSACDVGTTLSVESALLNSGHTIIMTSHDPEQLQRFSTRKLVLTELSNLDSVSVRVEGDIEEK